MENQRLTKMFLLLAVLQIVGVGYISAAPEISSTADGKFNKFLLSKMEQYGDWILENDLDPSQPISVFIVLPTYTTSRLELKCTVGQQKIVGHSNVKGDVPIVETYFSSHVFALGRDEIRTSHDIKGVYNCDGILFANADLDRDLPFYGEGNFTVQVKSAVEMMAFVNFGITENYEFNKTHSWYDYLYFPVLNQVKLVGVWDQTVALSKYWSSIDSGFLSVYEEFLSKDSLPVAKFNPSRQIFARFVDEIVTTTNLKEILLEEELPDPFFPTSTTTTTTTTSTTTKSPTSDNGSTTTTTTEGSGSSKSASLISSSKLGLLCLASAFVIKQLM